MNFDPTYSDLYRPCPVTLKNCKLRGPMKSTVDICIFSDSQHQADSFLILKHSNVSKTTDLVLSLTTSVVKKSKNKMQKT